MDMGPCDSGRGSRTLNSRIGLFGCDSSKRVRITPPLSPDAGNLKKSISIGICIETTKSQLKCTQAADTDCQGSAGVPYCVARRSTCSSKFPRQSSRPQRTPYALGERERIIDGTGLINNRGRYRSSCAEAARALSWFSLRYAADQRRRASGKAYLTPPADWESRWKPVRSIE
jgi:hypothetical protein